MNDIFLGTQAIRFGKPLGEHGVSSLEDKPRRARNMA
jgi:hypothetical protein